MQLAEASWELSIAGSAIPISMSEATVEGKVLSSAMGVVTIDTCPPGSNCTDAPATLKVSADNLPSNLVPPGALVRLRYSNEGTVTAVGGFGSARQLLIENLPDWMGATNPLSDTSRVWFAAFASEGAVGKSPSFVPYEMRGLSCGDCWPPADKQQLGVTFPGEEQVIVPTGQQRSFDITGSLAGHYVFQGLSARSDCEGYGALSYWLTGS